MCSFCFEHHICEAFWAHLQTTTTSTHPRVSWDFASCNRTSTWSLSCGHRHLLLPRNYFGTEQIDTKSEFLSTCKGFQVSSSGNLIWRRCDGVTTKTVDKQPDIHDSWINLRTNWILTNHPRKEVRSGMLIWSHLLAVKTFCQSSPYEFGSSLFYVVCWGLLVAIGQWAISGPISVVSRVSWLVFEIWPQMSGPSQRSCKPVSPDLGWFGPTTPLANH